MQILNRATLVWVFSALALVVSSAAQASELKEKGDIKTGSKEYTLTHGGKERTYLLHVPKGYDPNKPAPLVMFFHGGLGTADHAEKSYGWTEKSDAENFIMVYPNGTGRVQTWNAIHGCGASHESNVDDVGFVKALVDTLKKALAIDEKRIYATGMSNGAMLSYRLASEMSDVFAAAAPVAGAIGGSRSGGEVKKIKAPAQPVPMIIFHGMEDENVLYNGGETKRGLDNGRADLSVADAVKFWTEVNRCETTPVKTTSKSGNIITETYADPKNGNDVVLYSIKNGGHSWPGTKKARRAGGGTSEISATDLAWEFFVKHPKK